MISATAVFNKLHPDKWLARFSNPQPPADTPLLSRDEILSLRMQLDQNNNHPTYRHEVEHRTLGDARSVYRGYGMDYDESRPYFPGDELRFMNWRVTARTGQPHMKVFREERKPGVFIAVDRRQSMRFGTRRRLKVTQAVRAAAATAFSARSQNTPVAGVLLESGEKAALHWIPESFDESGVFNFIHSANRPGPPPHTAQLNGMPDTLNEESFSRVIKLLTPMLARGSDVILISDFHDLEDDCRSSLLELSMTHHLRAIQIIDPIELELPACGNILVPLQQGSYRSINSSDNQSRKQYVEAASALVESKQQMFKSLAIPSQRLMTDDDRIDQIVEF